MKFETLSRKILREPFFYSLVFVVIVLAVFFRTFDYLGRIGVLSDHAWLLQVSRYSFENLKIPLIGPFSSASGFFYGPWYFWIFGIITILPFGELTHWYVMTLISLFLIYLFFWIGREIGDKWVGIIAALFGAISTANIKNSFDVWSPALVPFLITLSIVFLLRFVKKQKISDLAILSFIVGLSITIHFQNLLLMPVIFVALATIFLGKHCFGQILIYLGTIAMGFAVPFLPLLYFDINNYWYNSRSLLVYLLVDQYNVWVPNRWLTFIFEYWPSTWANIIGGNVLIASLIILVLAVFTLANLKNLKKYKTFYIVTGIFILQIVMMRYYRGERFLYYSLFAHMPILVLSAFASREVFRFRKIFGFALVILVVVFTLRSDFLELHNHGGAFPLINSLKNDAYSAYPNSSFDVYGCRVNGVQFSQSLALFMFIDHKNSASGVKIGVCQGPDKIVRWSKIKPNQYKGKKPEYYNTNTETVYKEIAEWWMKSPPREGGDLWKFLSENWAKRNAK